MVNSIQLVLFSVLCSPYIKKNPVVKQYFKMSILRYITVSNKNVSNTDEFKEATAEVAKELEQGQSTPKRRGNYGAYSPKQRYEIGKYAAENSPTAAARKFSPLLDRKLNESTVRGFKKDYLSHVKSAVKRKLIDTDSEIHEEPEVLTPKKRGRKLLLGDELDNKVKRFVTTIRSSGGVVNTAIVKAAGRGVVLSEDRSLLRENGGHIEITRAWALSLMSRMDLVKRKGTTSKKVLRVDNFDSEKSKFLTKIQTRVTEYGIPPSLIINWDQTGLHVVPVSQWTMAEEGSKRVEIAGSEDKRQITGM